jgi:hypothetical protein
VGRDGVDVPPWRSEGPEWVPELGVHRVRQV